MGVLYLIVGRVAREVFSYQFLVFCELQWSELQWSELQWSELQWSVVSGQWSVVSG